MATSPLSALATLKPARLFRITPESALLWLAAAMPFAFSSWMVMVNNFTHEQAHFTGFEIGLLHSVREIPGFMAFALAYVLLFIKEQRLAYLALMVLAVGSAVTGHFTGIWGLLLITLVASIGFHFQEPVLNSLALQWLSKERAPLVLGQMAAVRAGVGLLAMAMVALCWRVLGLPYAAIYWIGGGLTALIVAYVWWRYPLFPPKVPQHQQIILRKRYWLFYALEFCSGARRQIFTVFAGWMLVERYGLQVHNMAWVMIATGVMSMVMAPIAGRVIARYGERPVLMFEYLGLFAIFVSYAFVPNQSVAIGLYMVDHLFFALAIGIKTYFQKIADPADIAGSAGMAFTINHIAAVFLPVGLGLLWLHSQAAVFLVGAGFAVLSLAFALMIPRRPEPGFETRFAGAG